MKYFASNHIFQMTFSHSCHIFQRFKHTTKVFFDKSFHSSILCVIRYSSTQSGWNDHFHYDEITLRLMFHLSRTYV